jgi:uncharacterized protein (TIGR02996 family)
MNDRRMVAAAERAWAAGDSALALEHALALWRASHDERVAWLCETLSAALERNLPQLPKGKREAMQRAWLEVEAQRRSCDLPRLVRSLSQTHFRSTDASVRAKKLLAWPRDPRATALLLGQLSRPTFQAASARGFWRLVFDLIQRQGDPRAAGLLRDYVSKNTHIFSQPATRSWFRARALELAAELASLPVPSLAADAGALVERWHARLEQADLDRQRLVDRVYAAPHADAPRAVYADCLLATNDPRGEFIALQLAGAEASKPRVAALLEAHEREWLGKLGTIAAQARWAKGFVSSITCYSEEDDAALAETVGDPSWATVRELRVDWSATAQRLVLHPVMRSLATLSTTPAVASAPPLPIRTLRLDCPLDAALAKRLSRSRSFKQVRQLSFWPEQGRWCGALAQLSWLKQLDTVGLCVDHRFEVGHMLQALAPFRGVKRVAFERDGNEWGMLAARTKRGWHLHVQGPASWAKSLVEMLEGALPALVEAVTLEVPLSAPLKARLTRALEAHQVQTRAL